MATARPTLVAEPRDITGKAVKSSALLAACRRSCTAMASTRRTSPSTRTRSSFAQAGLAQCPDRPVGRWQEGQPGPYQRRADHPVNRRPLHADLFLVRMTEELIVDVRLVTVGESAAVTQLNGTLLHPTESVRVKALPDHLPQSIEYSIDSLVDFDAAIHVRDLSIPDDVTLLTDPDEIIAKVQAPRIEVEEEPVVEEGEEGVEGEAAEGRGGAPRARLRPVASRHQTKARRKKADAAPGSPGRWPSPLGPSAGRPASDTSTSPDRPTRGQDRSLPGTDASPASGTG